MTWVPPLSAQRDSVTHPSGWTCLLHAFLQRSNVLFPRTSQMFTEPRAEGSTYIPTVWASWTIAAFFYWVLVTPGAGSFSAGGRPVPPPPPVAVATTPTVPRCHPCPLRARGQSPSGEISPSAETLASCGSWRKMLPSPGRGPLRPWHLPYSFQLN